MVDSTGSSAVFSQGRVAVTNCSFARCVTGTNDVVRSLEAYASSGGAAFQALGGAIQARGVEAALQSTGSSFVECAAQLANYANYGGAVYAAAMVRIERTRFDSNYVKGGTSEASITGGGALNILALQLDIADSEFISNKAKGTYEPDGGAIYLSGTGCTTFMPLVTDRLPDFCKVTSPDSCGAQLRGVTFMHNVATEGSGRAKGGALFMQDKHLCVSLTDSNFEGNLAKDSGGNTEGGAVQVRFKNYFRSPGTVPLRLRFRLQVRDKASLRIASTRFFRNAAQGATDQVRYSSLLHLALRAFEAAPERTSV